MVIINLIGSRKKIPFTQKDLTFIVKTFHKVANKKVGINLPLTIDCCLVSRKKIIQLNEKWRGKSQPAAILAFPDYYLKQKGEPVRGEIHLGDLIIAPEVIKSKAKENFGESNLKNFRLQFINSFIHSLAHLYGYTHDSIKNILKMDGVEKQTKGVVIKKLIRS